MLRSRAAWINSRPGTNWRIVASPFAAFASPVTALRFKKLQTGEYIAIGYYTPSGTSNPTVVISRSINLQTWSLSTIPDFSFGDMDGNGTVYIVVGEDLSGAGAHVKRFDATFNSLAAPTITPAVTSPRKIIWGRLAGTDYFVIAARTSYTYSSSVTGDAFTTLNYASLGTGGLAALDYYPEIDTYVELRSFILPVIFRMSNTIGAFTLDYTTFSTTGSVGGMFSLYDPTVNYIYIIVNRVGLTLDSSSFNFFVYTPAGVLVDSTTKTLPDKTIIRTVAHHPETGRLFLGLIRDGTTYEIQTVQVSFVPGFFTPVDVIIGDPQPVRNVDSAALLLTTNLGVMNLSTTGVISVSP
jgi:hypothetical protein